ncbi:MAG: hydrogenase maturation nickel metallochaperone HypA [Candidatus Geothermarchaeales archaeon]
MHEYSTTVRIVESILREAERHKAKRVTEVHLIIGKFTFLGVEQVRFCYRLLAEGSILKNSVLHIEEREGSVRCPECGYEDAIGYVDDPTYNLSYPTLRCPKCGGGVDLVEGRECIVKSVKIEV